MTINWTALRSIIVPYLVARSKERATYVALTGFLAAVFGITTDAAQLQAISSLVAVLASGILIAVPGSKATAAVVEAKAVSAETKLGAGPTA